MRLLLLYNPISGGGHAAAAAQRVAPRLLRAGLEVRTIETRRERPEHWLDAFLPGNDLLVVVGGDGAVRLAAGPAARTGVPIYQMPLGTENLFAREWGMDRDAETLLAALERWDVVRIDTAAVRADEGEAETFVLMASVGYDADVVHDLAARRTGGISHLSYLGPMLRTFRGYAAPRLRVAVDGRAIGDGGPGFLVVGNSRQYAMRMNPAAAADMQDGLLDVAYFPGEGTGDLVGWMLRCELGAHLRDPRLRYARGRTATIESGRPFRYQLDGDPPWTTPVGSAVHRLDIDVQPAALSVLVARRPQGIVPLPAHHPHGGETPAAAVGATAAARQEKVPEST